MATGERPWLQTELHPVWVTVVQGTICTTHYGTEQNSTAQFNGVQHSTAQYNTVQHITPHYITVQRSTAQYSTKEHIRVHLDTAQLTTVQCGLRNKAVSWRPPWEGRGSMKP